MVRTPDLESRGVGSSPVLTTQQELFVGIPKRIMFMNLWLIITVIHKT